MCLACRRGDKCPSPEKVRPSMEAMNIDVFATASKAHAHYLSDKR